ncbi:GNAT family N-acetyltransferase [Priestia filamentosa]|uniref:Histone acetyltransferase n=1 Tax=Priestia filamentosa TaxID=1402861 RepID=A0A1X7E9V4_9BACI|nr:GNAT family N-acetyltransferase [Priestia filamentosa]AKO92629.1 histone acetyltransferase [Priestia filamentosa]MDT3762709.1 GNAT family N-acetyltransferase [Priestia filamentosa]OXS69245.1 histone acetyltransferase [Priestia filamentosa]WCM13810.1 GNAT family N-acetyltransferase [Priestia filamentosa]WRU97171.1 GNAT family N-acetyltransferase [Priestia filamentosa]
MISLRNVQPTDLEQLLVIENEGFSIEEAATKEAMVERIQLISDTFIVAEREGKILGYINGPIINQPYITDDLFEETKENPKRGGYQSILGLAVSKQARNQGIARILIKKMEDIIKENKREGITLTCKQELVPFYEKCGFVNHGVSESNHGGLTWYNLIKLRESIS